MRPSQVLPGEMRGASLWRPTALPTKRAAESAVMIVVSSSISTQGPPSS